LDRTGLQPARLTQEWQNEAQKRPRNFAPKKFRSGGDRAAGGVAVAQGTRSLGIAALQAADRGETTLPLNFMNRAVLLGSVPVA
jgi:hypothetical protein